MPSRKERIETLKLSIQQNRDDAMTATKLALERQGKILDLIGQEIFESELLKQIEWRLISVIGITGQPTDTISKMMDYASQGFSVTIRYGNYTLTLCPDDHELILEARATHELLQLIHSQNLIVDMSWVNDKIVRARTEYEETQELYREFQEQERD